MFDDSVVFDDLGVYLLTYVLIIIKRLLPLVVLMLTLQV